MTSVKTISGAVVVMGGDFDYSNTTRAEREFIERREQEFKARQRALPKRRKPDHTKPGPVTWVQF